MCIEEICQLSPVSIVREEAPMVRIPTEEVTYMQPVHGPHRVVSVSPLILRHSQSSKSKEKLSSRMKNPSSGGFLCNRTELSTGKSFYSIATDMV